MHAARLCCRSGRSDWIRFSPATVVVPDDVGLRPTVADKLRAAKAVEAALTALARANPKMGEGQPSSDQAPPTFFDGDRQADRRQA
jgi:hypothetical protein